MGCTLEMRFFKTIFLLTALSWGHSTWAFYMHGCEAVVKVIDVQQKSFLQQTYGLTVEVERSQHPCFEQTELFFDFAIDDVNVTNYRSDTSVTENDSFSEYRMLVEHNPALWQPTMEHPNQYRLDVKTGDLLYLIWMHIDGECGKEGKLGFCFSDRISIKKWDVVNKTPIQ